MRLRALSDRAVRQGRHVVELDVESIYARFRTTVVDSIGDPRWFPV